MPSDVELAAMRHAIMLSANGLGTTSPNPPVGCVILDERQQIVGGGYHRRKGEAHAEVNALAAAGTAARGGTAVVTLEPCNHVGVAPACRQELLEAGIQRVVIGVMDPTSRGIGGAATLTAAGVDVETGALTDGVLTVLGPWMTATQRRRPYLTWAYATDPEHAPSAEERLTRRLRNNVDVVIGNHTAEGITGGHAPRHFAVPADADPSTNLHQWLAVAYGAGARSILIVGNDKSDMMRRNFDAIDEIVVAHRQAGPTQGLAEIGRLLIPAGFGIVDLAAEPDSLTARFRRQR
jgi:diaminohydroxyphosphoribosylaminopyrimidine deaminase/5-amino-6-(5-phosphoribosylamino)uracil reductase